MIAWSKFHESWIKMTDSIWIFWIWWVFLKSSRLSNVRAVGRFSIFQISEYFPWKSVWLLPETSKFNKKWFKMMHSVWKAQIWRLKMFIVSESRVMFEESFENRQFASRVNSRMSAEKWPNTSDSEYLDRVRHFELLFVEFWSFDRLIDQFAGMFFKNPTKSGKLKIFQPL